VGGWARVHVEGVSSTMTKVEIAKAQIREQMSGPDLHVFTLKFLALKKLFFPP
jgi:hypothetical protein